MNSGSSRVFSPRFLILVFGILIVGGVIIWQAYKFSGNPDPAGKNLDAAAVILSCGVLVFREGLEAILVLAAITAALAREKENNYGRSVAAGSALGFAATVATWFIVVAILSNLNLPELDIQAATGLLAIVVLLVVMNWFFHKIYWTGWINHHTKRRKRLMDSPDKTAFGMFKGFALLGFTAIYREGFEIVLFLQQLRLKEGDTIVLTGAAVGLLLTSIVAVLTFKLHKHLPYKKMLVLTGVLLGIVLLVMVGESVQEMQQAGWIPVTNISISFPSWLGVWFAVFPNLQSLSAQAVAVLLVLGSYITAGRINLLRSSRT